MVLPIRLVVRAYRRVPASADFLDNSLFGRDLKREIATTNRWRCLAPGTTCVTIRGLPWWMIGLIMLGSIINDLTRSTLGVAARKMLPNLGITAQ